MALLRNNLFLSRTFLRRSIVDRLKRSNLKFWAKNSYFSLDFVSNNKVYIYNGIRFIGVSIEANLVGNALGTLCFTKKQGSQIHSNSKKAKVKKKVSKKKK